MFKTQTLLLLTLALCACTGRGSFLGYDDSAVGFYHHRHDYHSGYDYYGYPGYGYYGYPGYGYYGYPGYGSYDYGRRSDDYYYPYDWGYFGRHYD